jgi:predicted transcriptional regulator
MSDDRARREPAQWTYLSNHSHVLVCLARRPDARIRDVAAEVHITERAVQKILQDLEVAGVVRRYRVGRRNLYRINPGAHLRHPVEGHCTVGELLTFVLGPEAWKPATREPELQQDKG